MRTLGPAALVATCLLWAGGAVGLAVEEEKAWMRALTPLTPLREAVPPLEGVGRYVFGWSGLVAARGELRFKEARPGVRGMELGARTVGGVRSLWRLDAKALSEVDAATLLPLRMRQWERYRSRNVISALQFVPGGVWHSKGRIKGEPPRAFFEEPVADKAQLEKMTGEKAKRFRFPALLDGHAALLWVRQQPLKAGDRLEVVIFQENAAYLARLRVRGREMIAVRGKQRAAIPVEISLVWVDKEYKLQPHKRFKSATGWYSDDAERVPLKLEVEIFVGRVWAELESFGPFAGGQKG